MGLPKLPTTTGGPHAQHYMPENKRSLQVFPKGQHLSTLVRPRCIGPVAPHI